MHTLIFVVPKIPTMHILLKSYQILVGTQCKLLPQKPTSRYSISFQPTIKNECSTRIISNTRVTLLKILHSIRTYFISVVVITFTIQMFLECNKPGNTRAGHKHISSCTTAYFDTPTIPPYKNSPKGQCCCCSVGFLLFNLVHSLRNDLQKTLNRDNNDVIC